MDPILEQVMEVVGDFASGKYEGTLSITRESRLVDDMDMDSLEILSFRTVLESKFNIEISDEWLVQARTVGDVADHIRMRLTPLQLTNEQPGTPNAGTGT